MNLVKFGSCWINPKHISCAKIKETFNEFKGKVEYALVVVCYGYETAMYYDHREDAEQILNEVIVKAIEVSDNNGNAQN